MPISVKDLEADLYKYYEEWFFFNMTDFHVSTEYVDSRHFNVIVTRLDHDMGWNIHLEVLVFIDPNTTTSTYRNIVSIGTSDFSTKTVCIETDFDISPGPSYSLAHLTYYGMDQTDVVFEHIGLDEFNRRFNADIAYLPVSLFAIGIQEGRAYCYNAEHPHSAEHFWWKNVNRPAIHMIRVAKYYHLDSSNPFYFVLSDCDGGYFEKAPHFPYRYRETTIENDQENEICRGIYGPTFPLFHRNKYLLGPSNQTCCPLLLSVPDRHYFYHNLYHSFRSFHGATPFSDKIAKIVYGGNPKNSHPNNFKTFRCPDNKNQREYFLSSDDIDRTNVVSGNISRQDMVRYKYILDIDGHGSTWDATAWKLNSGSVLFKTESIYEQWFYDQFKPYVHYIPIAENFADLNEKFQWCESHPLECGWIIKNARQLFREVYSYPNVIQHTKQMMEQKLLTH